MIKFLLDANLSPATAKFLEKLGFDSRSITNERLGYLLDEDIVKIAKKEKRVIVTFDLDFGEIYHAREEGKIGVIVLRLKNQTPESVNSVLKNFIQNSQGRLEKNQKSLIVIKEKSIRFIK